MGGLGVVLTRPWHRWGCLDEVVVNLDEELVQTVWVGIDRDHVLHSSPTKREKEGGSQRLRSDGTCLGLGEDGPVAAGPGALVLLGETRMIEGEAMGLTVISRCAIAALNCCSVALGNCERERVGGGDGQLRGASERGVASGGGGGSTHLALEKRPRLLLG